LGFLIAGIIGGALVDENFIIGGLIGAALGWIVGKAIESQKVNKNGIKNTTNASISKYPVIDEYIKQGWTFYKPTA
jgi:hypothetical protein